MRGMAAPAVSPASQGRIYFDSTANKYKVSQNGGAYADLVGGGSGDFNADGTVAMSGHLRLGANYINNDGGAEGLSFFTNGSAVFSTNIYAGAGSFFRLTEPQLSVGNNAWTGAGPTITVGGTNFSTSVFSMQNTTTGSASGEDGLSMVMSGNDLSINNQEAGYIALSTSNAERIRINSTGSVGIGTTTPVAKLHVSGTIVNTVNTFTSAFTCGTSTLDFSTSNFQRLNPSNTIAAGSCNVALSNLVAGGSYSLVVLGNGATNAVTYNFTGYTFKYLPINGPTIAGKDTIYTFLYDGTTVYVTWTGGY